MWAKSLGIPLSEIKHDLDMCGQRGEGRIQKLSYVIEKTDEAIAELRVINARSRQTLADKQREEGSSTS